MNKKKNVYKKKIFIGEEQAKVKVKMTLNKKRKPKQKEDFAE